MSNHTILTSLLAATLTALTLLSGCAGTPQTGALLDQPPDGLPPVSELSGTPFFPQQRYQCGPAALATVLASHSLAVTPDDLTASVYVPRLRGSLPEEMAATARRHGMLVYPLAPSLRDLLVEIAAGHPVLVMQNLGTRALPRRHFAVAVGYDLRTRQMVLRSGTTRRWLTPLEVFERTWARSGYRAMVILPPADIPATATADNFLRSVLDLESSDQTDAVRTATAVAIERWPANAHTWMAHGNRLYADRHYQQSATAFQAAVELEADNPQGWNNLAYALAAAGCSDMAGDAVRTAVNLAPHDPAYRQSQADIDTLLSARRSYECPAALRRAATQGANTPVPPRASASADL